MSTNVVNDNFGCRGIIKVRVEKGHKDLKF